MKDMKTFAMYCKTYIGDIEPLKVMLDSFKRHNKQNIEMYVSCPRDDMEKFRCFGDKTVHILADEDYDFSYYHRGGTKYGFSIGYFHQEICKLAFWETGLCENYLCIDSDGVFIRDFEVSDFMWNEEVPYTVLMMDKDLSVEKQYQSYWDWRKEKIMEIYQFLELENLPFRTCHGFQIMNARVLKALKEYLGKRDMGYSDAIELSPFEFSWYNCAALKFNEIPIIAVEPYFKYFHNRTEYKNARRMNIGIHDWSRAYIGIVMNSNWNKKHRQYREPSIITRFIYCIDNLSILSIAGKVKSYLIKVMKA